MAALMRTRRGIGAALVVAAVAVAAPVVLSESALRLTTLFLPFALLALSVNLLWGELRLVSFGQGAFFALGGYAGGLILVGHPYDPAGSAASLLDGGGGQTTFERVLDTLHGIAPAGLPIAALIVPTVLCGVVGLAVGGVVFRAASPEVYLPIVTLGIGVVAGIWFNDIEFIGASNGLGNIPELTAEIAPGSRVAPYVFNAVVLGIAFGAYALFRSTTRGASWRALGDDPVRLEALGYPVARMRAVGFGASCAIAGLAGTLYAATANFMSPSLANVTLSAQALIWVAVGGVGTVLGPLVGTLVVKWGEELLSSRLGLTSSWPLLLGLLLIAVVLVAPGGLLGSRRSRQAAAGALAPLPSLARRPAVVRALTSMPTRRKPR